MMLLHSNAKLPPTEKLGRLTTDQYFAMIKQGIITEGAPYELLDGLLVLKDRSKKGEDIMSIGGYHNMTVGFVFELDKRLSNRGCFMQSQGPVQIPPRHAPEPDGALIKGKRRDYPEPPTASDVLSVIEVADSSLKSDREDKGSKYAEAGIPQFVLINLIDFVIENYESPDKELKKYSECKTFSRGEKVPFLMADGTRLEVAVDDLLP